MKVNNTYLSVVRFPVQFFLFIILAYLYFSVFFIIDGNFCSYNVKVQSFH